MSSLSILTHKPGPRELALLAGLLQPAMVLGSEHCSVSLRAPPLPTASAQRSVISYQVVLSMAGDPGEREELLFFYALRFSV